MSPSHPPRAPLNRPIRLAVLISGGGTTLLNFLEKIRAGELSADIRLVIASRADCSGVAKCEKAGLRCEVIPRKFFADTSSFSKAVFWRLRNEKVDLVTLAGFLSLIEIPEDFSGRVMNVHPALIPAFCGQGMYGHKVHEAVLARGAKVSGCTVHFADNRYDHGPIILQRAVPVEEGDTPDSLANRVFAAECEAYPEAIRLFAAGRLKIQDGRTEILSESPEVPANVAPVQVTDWNAHFARKTDELIEQMEAAGGVGAELASHFKNPDEFPLKPIIERLKSSDPNAITRELIDETPDSDVADLLFGYADDFIIHGDENAIASLPKGLQWMWHVSVIESEVPNGGFSQFFYNTPGSYVLPTLEALRASKADRRAAVLEKALQLFRDEVGRPFDFPDRWEGEWPADENCTALDYLYYAEREDELIDWVPYIRSHPEEFMHP